MWRQAKDHKDKAGPTYEVHPASLPKECWPETVSYSTSPFQHQRPNERALSNDDDPPDNPENKQLQLRGKWSRSPGTGDLRRVWLRGMKGDKSNVTSGHGPTRCPAAQVCQCCALLYPGSLIGGDVWGLPTWNMVTLTSSRPWAFVCHSFDFLPLN